jgi:hypothetical protein
MSPLAAALAAAGRGLVMVLLFVAAAAGTRAAGASWLPAEGGSGAVAGGGQASPSTPVPSTGRVAAASPAATAGARPIPAAPSPTQKPVSAEAILRALQEQPLIGTDRLEGRSVSGPDEYVTPGDTVESARFLGGVEYTIDTGPENAVFAAILMFEAPQDAQVELDGELVASESAGEPFIETSLDGTTVYCSPDGVVCTTTIGRAYIRVAGGVAAVDAPAVEPGTRAAIASLAAARAKAAAGG